MHGSTAQLDEAHRLGRLVVERPQTAYHRLLDSLPAGVAPDDPVNEIAWMIEEMGVSLFAQSLGTPRPVSERRTLQAIHAAQD